MRRFQTLRQLRRFKKLRRQFGLVYRTLGELGEEPFVEPFWGRVNSQVASEFLPIPPINFLDLPAIKNTMFVDPDQEWIDSEVSFLNTRKDGFEKIIIEDTVGNPLRVPFNGINTSYNSIHHFYHIKRFEAETKVKILSVTSVVEWGGGYGNLAKLWWRLKDQKTTYTIIDTALFCSIQWLYLSSVLGPDKINLLKSRSDKILANKVNLAPLALLENTEIAGDLFISTWGLSESAAEAQDYVVSKQWFGAKHLLLGFQDSTKELRYASRLGKIAANDGATIVDIDFIPGNHYAFK